MSGRRIGADVRKRARELLNTGRTLHQARILLAAEGMPVSYGWLQRLSVEPLKPTPGAPQAPPTPPPSAPEDVQELLQESIAVLRTFTQIAKAENDISRFGQLQRVLNATLALSAKLAPPPPPDPNLQPDYQAAAERARRHLREQLAFLFKADDERSG